jgi:hypothetical protein
MPSLKQVKARIFLLLATLMVTQIAAQEEKGDIKTDLLHAESMTRCTSKLVECQKRVASCNDFDQKCLCENVDAIADKCWTDAAFEEFGEGCSEFLMGNGTAKQHNKDVCAKQGMKTTRSEAPNPNLAGLALILPATLLLLI